MSEIVDARGLSCPQPVLDTLAKISAMGSGEIEVLVDTEASRENVARAAQGKGWSVDSISEDQGDYHLKISKKQPESMLKFFTKRAAEPQGRKQADRGLLVFENTSEVIRAEKTLKAGGWAVKVMGPPPEIQKGCDLVVEFPLIEELNIVRRLGEAGVPPLDVVPVTGPLLKPVDLFHTKDFGDHLMVRAANMKLTVRKADRVIVNVSGGGCPDVPYLAVRLIGMPLDQAPSPREIGHTLCGYALGLAFEEMKRLCSL